MISTNEKKVAIDIWSEIRERIIEDENVDVVAVKHELCKQHKKKWRCNCLLCEYFMIDGGVCRKECPLMKKAIIRDRTEVCGCSSTIPSDYKIVISEDWEGEASCYPLEKRLEAIENIINAIKEA